MVAAGQRVGIEEVHHVGQRERRCADDGEDHVLVVCRRIRLLQPFEAGQTPVERADPSNVLPVPVRDRPRTVQTHGHQESV